ncbi:hypothetical protein SLA_3983 [Streptomyces laurentii]|uniref:Uncharacterized protein n=1 Tax=Streptomyces laurentii TaxID=39478 RepID=A0A169NPC6_STRLU|nr:hypothetical protein SLA_3983 [Streptomyces laurentii]
MTAGCAGPGAGGAEGTGGGKRVVSGISMQEAAERADALLWGGVSALLPPLGGPGPEDICPWHAFRGARRPRPRGAVFVLVLGWRCSVRFVHPLRVGVPA